MTKTNISIKEIKTNEELEEFLLFSECIYKRDKIWVEPLIREEQRFFNKKNPYWSHAKCKLFIAKNKDGEIVGRIGAFIDKKYIKHTKERVGYFGFFEVFNNIEIAKQLFNKTTEWLKKNKIKIIRGPINGTISKETGFLIHGFNLSPEPLMTYNPRYYNTLMQKLKFKKKVDLFAYKIDINKVKDSILEKKNNNIKIKPLNKLRLKQDIKEANNIINKGMSESHHFQFVPSSLREFSYMSKDLMHFIDKNLILFAEKNNKKVGVVIALPNYNQLTKRLHGKIGILDTIKLYFQLKTIKDGKLEIISILPKHTGQHIGTAMMNQLFKNLKNKDYKTIEYSWVEENNEPSKRLALHYKGKLCKKYRVYEKKI